MTKQVRKTGRIAGFQPVLQCFLGRKGGGRVAKADGNREKSNNNKIGQRKNKEKQKNLK
jgi:hypothetical protein